MEDKNFQKELFNEFEAIKRKKAHSTILPKNFAPVNISYEQIVFITIAVMMLMVFLFSLGVERGRHLADLDKVESVQVVKKSMPPLEEPVQVETKTPVIPKLYTIQVIAYRSKKSAQDEMSRIGRMGLNPFIIVGGGYYQICVGEYKDYEEAKGDLLKLKKTYKDSFVRKR